MLLNPFSWQNSRNWLLFFHCSQLKSQLRYSSGGSEISVTKLTSFLLRKTNSSLLSNNFSIFSKKLGQTLFSMGNSNNSNRRSVFPLIAMLAIFLLCFVILDEELTIVYIALRRKTIIIYDSYKWSSCTQFTKNCDRRTRTSSYRLLLLWIH